MNIITYPNYVVFLTYFSHENIIISINLVVVGGFVEYKKGKPGALLYLYSAFTQAINK